MGEQLDPTQRQDMLELVGRNRDVFSEEPGHTELPRHPIITESGKKVKQRPYHIPEARREALRTKIRSGPRECGCAVPEGTSTPGSNHGAEWPCYKERRTRFVQRTSTI
ncbi:hypothetical protein AAFF_G00398380 [Aldrovandia affinis]|uniref:Uncharacterized protein n=1 Tax=Aldrovandia affinis TaxID=143900 RepID=A0AAD7SCW2_9TELE|nr:hypothetical protein AAFF_G00398380 [Aldrovandia affinis]